MPQLFKLAAVALAVAALAPTVAQADDGISYNVGAVSEYRYRGISQTRLKPALQGGVDYAKGPFYVGTWLSTIKWIKDAGGDANVEWDIYGGYKGEISKDLSYDVGVLRYQYLKTAAANTLELYGALSYGPGTVKYSHSTTNLFGTVDSKNSGYLEASATYEYAGLSIVPHIGYQSVANNGTFSYTDYSLTVSKEVAKGLTLSAAVIGTDTKDYVGAGKDLGKSALVLGAKYAF